MSRAVSVPAQGTGVEDALARTIGAEHVSTGNTARRFAAADFSDRMLAVPAAVVRPGSTEYVAVVLRICRDHGLSATVRGGGMSYTLAHLPSTPDSVVIDVARLDRIVEVNRPTAMWSSNPESRGRS
ncbi:hypothetical protein PA7_44000 [Pseudonocardia asaccharolytica DSM 44247 = NBRC 16224]|uniref:FAD-binding PCMH-type domain-containing protein n=1 Tax=Pseudonocardia asaccharolytica DSM 44247 = NBRC 16224 TaxID=1123024 RepID=A0A511D815_9PSEU|nr:FAD-binding protein [Pseudonocardia asaccharolytica]GEL20563.1 hypothetical protein PA7_44000 [Pseudonocardia asaccharolytica DSM 44247 = NBRC 16224]